MVAAGSEHRTVVTVTIWDDFLPDDAFQNDYLGDKGVRLEFRSLCFTAIGPQLYRSRRWHNHCERYPAWPSIRPLPIDQCTVHSHAR